MIGVGRSIANYLPTYLLIIYNHLLVQKEHSRNQQKDHEIRYYSLISTNENSDAQRGHVFSQGHYNYIINVTGDHSCDTPHAMKTSQSMKLLLGMDWGLMGIQIIQRVQS